MLSRLVVLPIGLLALVPLTVPAQEKKDRKVEPIKVVAIDHKDAVVYEKEIEPIFVNKCLFCVAGRPSTEL